MDGKLLSKLKEEEILKSEKNIVEDSAPLKTAIEGYAFWEIALIWSYILHRWDDCAGKKEITLEH